MTTSYHCTWAKQGLALHNSGQALLCCQSRCFLQDDQGQNINWHQHSLDQAWRSVTRTQILDDLAQGKQHENCQACWDTENSGGVSKRMEYAPMTFDDHLDVDRPRLLDLKLGNICNLSCRTCNPWVSSKWMKDWYEVFEKNTNSQFANYDHYIDNVFRIGRLSYADNNQKFWQELDEWFPYARFIDIYGAEPMLIDKLFDVLQTSIDQGHATKQSLHFNTNGTIWDDRKINILTQFKHVSFDISIDGLYKHFDYIRHGETWDVVMANLERYDHMRRANPHCTAQVCITVSLFNIYYLDELWNYFSDRGWHPHFNMAHLPRQVSIKALPDEVKPIVREKLLRNTNASFQKHIPEILNYMDQPFSDDPFARSKQYENGVWYEVVRSTRELDRFRKQNFAETFPEFWAVVEPYFNLESSARSS